MYNWIRTCEPHDVSFELLCQLSYRDLTIVDELDTIYSYFYSKINSLINIKTNPSKPLNKATQVQNQSFFFFCPIKNILRSQLIKRYERTKS